MAPLTPGTKEEEISHYAVLDLPQTSGVLRKADVKAAYHRALLKHHPDKSGSPARNGSAHGHTLNSTRGLSSTRPLRTHTIDEITTAYKILSDPAGRAEYDRSVRLSRRAAGSAADADQEEDVAFRTGLEVFDLDELEVESQDTGRSGSHDEGTTWYRGCRCGDEKGFLVREQDLEREIERGEIIVGCRGCSLWAKVVFAVEEDDQAEFES